eukprot:SAG31_NODE_1113_length_9854_cov_2.770682_8_plen_285_part_00
MAAPWRGVALVALLAALPLLPADGGPSLPREVHLYVWSGSPDVGTCAGCAILPQPVNGSWCRLVGCPDDGAPSCINGSACATVLPEPIVAEMAAQPAEPLFSGVFAYTGYALNSAGVQRPPKFALRRAAASAAWTHQRNMSFAPIVGGSPWPLPWHPGDGARWFRAHSSMVAEFITMLVADAHTYSFDGYHFDMEFGQLSEEDSLEYTRMLVALQRRLDGVSMRTAAVNEWPRQPPIVSVFANGFGNRSTCTQFRDGWNSCSEVHPVSPNTSVCPKTCSFGSDQ